MKRLILGLAALCLSIQCFACAALTKKGTVCKRAPVPGSQYCWQHGGKTSSSTQIQAPEPKRSVAANAVVEEIAPAADGGDEMSDISKDYRNENESLRRENQKLRRELVRQKEGEPVIAAIGRSSKTNGGTVGARESTEDDGGWWLSSRGKRHNSKCRYYKTGSGRPCEKGEGEACKKCGG